MPNLTKDLGVFYESMNLAIAVLVLSCDRTSVFTEHLDRALEKVA